MSNKDDNTVLHTVACESVKAIKNDNIPPTPCNYQKMFILKAKSFNMPPKEILTYLCDLKENMNTEEEIRALSGEVFKTIDKVSNTVNYVNENVSNLLKSYDNVDLETHSQEDLSMYLLKLKQENIDMHQKLQSTIEDIKEQKNTIQKVYNLINKDVLMNIYSRRYMESKLNDLVYEYKRYAHPFSILMIDIDDFKKINDTYGHDVGDSVLMKIGELLRISLRQTDIPSRYGGDEIVVLLPNTTTIYAQKTAFKIQSLFRKVKFKKSEKEFSLTLSIGVYEFHPEDTIESILKKADLALYQAKSDGKDKVIVYND